MGFIDAAVVPAQGKVKGLVVRDGVVLLDVIVDAGCAADAYGLDQRQRLRWLS